MPTSQRLWLKKESGEVKTKLNEIFCPRFITTVCPTDVSSRSQILSACLMIVDVSGFTKQASIMSDAGQCGLDALRHMTSDILTRYLDQIERYGGEVIAFAGDALICIFHSQLQNEMFAVTCAYKLKDYTARGLATHVAVVTGDVYVSVLGGYQDNWVYVVGGECFSTLNTCLSAAKSSQLVICATTYKAILPYISHAEAIDGYCSAYRVLSMKRQTSLAVFPRAISVLEGAKSDITSRFISAPVKVAILANSLENLSELRIVTTLFLNLTSYDMSRNPLELQPLFYAYQTIIAECGGMMRQFLVDDKGCVLIVLFGVPTASYMNNCSRAVRCAVQMTEKTRDMAHSCSIGITTGKAYCGLIGSSSRQEYVAIGKMVNLAARLMAESQDRILLDQTTHAHLSDDIAEKCQTLSPMALKGFKQKVKCYAFVKTANLYLSNVQRKNYTSSPMSLNPDALSAIATATRECDRIQKCLCAKTFAAEAAYVKYMVVRGAPGCGKTFFLQSLWKGFDKSNFQHLSIDLSCEPQIATIYELILLKAIAMVIHRHPTTTIQDIIHRYAIKPQSENAWSPNELANNLDRLNSLRQPNSSRSISTASPDLFTFNRAKKVYPSLLGRNDDTALLRGIQCIMTDYQCVAITIDGAEYLSEEGWRQLLEMQKRKWPLLVVVAVRDERDVESVVETVIHQEHSISFSTARAAAIVSTTYSSNDANESFHFDMRLLQSGYTKHVDFLCSNSRNTCLRMRHVTYIETGKLLHDAVAPAAVDIDTITNVYNLSGGNRFWITLLCRTIAELGIHEFEQLICSEGHRDILAACLLAKCNYTQSTVIKYASVLGSDISLPLLNQVIPARFDIDITTAMEEMCGFGLVRRVSPDFYRFQNVLLRDIIYNMIPPSDVEVVHKVAAELGESQGADAAMLVYHYFHSSKAVRHKAFPHCLSAAKNAALRERYTLMLCYLCIALKLATCSILLCRYVRATIDIFDCIASEHEEERRILDRLRLLRERARLAIPNTLCRALCTFITFCDSRISRH